MNYEPQHTKIHRHQKGDDSKHPRLWHASDIPKNIIDIIDNPSLYYSKYLYVSISNDKGKGINKTLEHLNKVKEKSNRELYGLFKEARRKWLPKDSVTIHLKTADRLIVDHTGGIIENAGLALDRHTGIPYIPGSAIKGITRMGAKISEASPEEINIVLGYEHEEPQKQKEDFAGIVSFLPAYPVNDYRLEIDIVTPHHNKYYSGEKTRALDTESPIPNKFITVGPDVEFMFTIVLISTSRRQLLREIKKASSDFDYLTRAKEWLIVGLTKHGIGAKTSSGYGWFIYDEQAEKKRIEKQRKQEEDARIQAQKQAADEKRKASMSPFERYMEEISNVTDDKSFIYIARNLEQKQPDYQRAFICILRSKRKETWKRYKKRKPELAEKLKQIAKQQGEELT